MLDDPTSGRVFFENVIKEKPRYRPTDQVS